MDASNTHTLTPGVPAWGSTFRQTYRWIEGETEILISTQGQARRALYKERGPESSKTIPADRQTLMVNFLFIQNLRILKKTTELTVRGETKYS